MKLRALTKLKIKETPEVSKVSKVKKISKPKKVTKETTFIPGLTLSLSASISPNYKGISDSIGGVLNSLPKELKTLFINTDINTAVLRQGSSMFVLDNAFTVFVKEVTIKHKVKRSISIKHGKNYVFSATI